MVVDYRAHPYIFSQPKHFTDAPYLQLSFEDGPNAYDSNTIALYPGTRTLQTLFFAGSNHTYGLPDSYTTYRLYYARNAVCTTADLDEIFTWENMKTLKVIENTGKAAVYLCEYAEKLSNHLAYIAFRIQSTNYKSINIRRFIEKLPALHQIIFFVDQLSGAQAEEFVSQSVPYGWNAEIRRDEDWNARVVAWERTK